MPFLRDEGHPVSQEPLQPDGEKERIRKLNETYESDPYYRRIWRRDSPASLFMADRKWELIQDIVERERIDVASAWILDLGVGTGGDADRFGRLNIRRDRFFGLDMLEKYASSARASYPWMHTVAGDAGRLPFPDGRFNLVYQSTMLSSVPERVHRASVFGEIDRVLAPGGVFLSYDTRYPNPWNPHTRPLRATEVREALRGWSVKTWSLTALPQLQRAVASFSLAGCRLLERVPCLRSHLLILARKPSSGPARIEQGPRPRSDS